jgi:glycosyltransferase involved in cell wall biosynthesis
MNKVCVIMSVYIGDSLDDLLDSLSSLYRQTYKNFDIFIQCDGQVKPDVDCFLHAEKSNKKLFFLQKRVKNKGLAYSLNELLEIVLAKNYDYIARMDADDICEPDRLFHQLAFMESNKECDVVGSNIVEFYEDGTEKLVLYHTSHKKIKSAFSTKTAIPHVSAFFRRSFFEKSGLYNIVSNRNEDQWLWLNGFLNKCVFASIPKELVKVRMSLNLLKRRGDFKHNLDTFKLRNRIVFLLKFNKIYYLYNVLVLFVKMQPTWLLRIIYKLR